MSDSLANEATLEATSEGQSQRASGEQSQGSNATGQTSNNGQSAKTEKDNISALKSVYDTRINGLTNELTQYQQAYSQVIQRLNDAEIAGAGSDFEKEQVRANQAQRRVAELEAQLARQVKAQEEASARNNGLARLATRYGCDVEELERKTRGITDYDDAADVARELGQKVKGAVAEKDSERREANRTDIGGGRSSSTIEELEANLKKAKESRDSGATIRYQRLIAQAKAAATRKK